MLSLNKLVLISGLLAVGMTGCSMFGHRNDGRTAGRVTEDKQITSAIRHDLNNEPVYKLNSVGVTTFDGVVQLNGFVFSEEQKTRAAGIAQRVQGVSRVVNGITVVPEPNPDTWKSGSSQTASGQSLAPVETPHQANANR